MQDREPIIPDHIWSLPRKPAGLPDVLSRNRDDVLVLREPYGDRARPVLLATMALAASFALGWAGALNWPEVANLLGVAETTIKTHLRRIFIKTGAERQADLIKLAAGFAMPLSR